MKIPIKRKNRKLKKLKFSCPRCGLVFLADLYPDCQYKYDPVQFHKINPKKEISYTDCFHSISTTCPDCGQDVLYNKVIYNKQSDGIVIT